MKIGTYVKGETILGKDAKLDIPFIKKYGAWFG